MARLRRDIFRSSDIGVILVNKDETGGYFNRTYGADANFIFFNNLALSSYLLKSDTPGLQGKDLAGNFKVAWTDRLLDLEVSHLNIQENFNPEVGFLPRPGMKKSSGEFALTPRPEGRIPWIREFRPSVNVDYITNQEDIVETKEMEQRFTVLFHNQSFVSVFHRSTFDRPREAEDILGREIVPGDYQFDETSVVVSSDPSRMFSGFLRWGTGTFYNGKRDSYFTGFGFQPSARFSADISWSHNDLVFPDDAFDTDLVNARIVYSFNTDMFLNALIQYNSQDGEISSNIRFNWIHHPLSDLYLVYNERRSPRGDIIDRALIAKLTYLFNF